jgi:DME family drug/metabolite transporter
MNLSRRQIGIAQVLLSGFCFGFLGIFGRWAYANGTQPEELLALRFLFAAILLGLYLCLSKGLSSLRISKNLILYCSLLGIFGYAVFASFYFYAIQKLSITLAVLLLYTFPFWVVLGGWFFLKEKLTTRQFLIFPLALIGLTLLIGIDFNQFAFAGLVFGTLSAMTYAAYIILSRKWIDNLNPLVAVFYIQLSAGTVLFFKSFQSLERTQSLIYHSWISIIGLALICSVFAMALFQSGLQKIKSWEASLLSTTEPVAGIALAYFIFGETLLWQQWLGAAALLLSFVAISLS